MLKLIAENPESANPVLPVRWCIERADAEKLKEKGARNIHVLFVISYEGGYSEDRWLVPIDQMLAYLTFRRPGKHTVFAKVVYGNDVESLGKTNYLERTGRHSYRYEALNYKKTGLRIDHIGPGLPGEAELVVVVPKEHFPAEPPAWLKRVVNWGHPYEPEDKCQFRRRLMLTPIKLFFAGIWAVITTVIRLALAAFLLLGMRDIDFGAIIRPWRDDIPDVFMNLEDSWFIADGKGNLRPYFLFLHPLFWVLVWKVGFVALGCAIVFATVVAVWLVKDKPVSEKFVAGEIDELYKAIACSPTPAIPTLAALPPERRTIYLRYQDIKAKVCRPFAR